MNNITYSFRNNQEKNKIFNLLLGWIFNRLPASVDHELLSVRKFTENSRRILMTLLRYCGLYKDVYISQETIALHSGVHHDTVWRTLKLFHDIGIIKKVYRGVRQTCSYSLTSFLHDPSVKWALKDLLPNLFWAIENKVRVCKTFLSTLLSSIYKPDTARLLNNKNKDIYKDKNNQKQINLGIKNNHELLDLPDIPDHIKDLLEKKLQEEENNKKQFADEMKKILGIKF